MEYKEKKAYLREVNSAVVRPIPRLDDDIVPRKRPTKPKKYTPLRMKNAINKYFEWCEESDEIPSIKGMMIHLRLYREAFYDYLKYPGFTDIMEHARMIIANWAETDVYTTKGLAAGKIAYMKNIHGWADKLDTHNVTEQRVITVEEARSKIEMLAPQLLELLKSHTVVQQIGHTEDAEVIEK
jgi:hypothetical protein